MNDLPPVPQEGEVPRAIARHPSPRTLQLVWIIPVIAALIGGGIFLKSVLEHGASITIRFDSAEGIEAGKTKIKHKAVDIGTVRSVRLSPDHKTAIVTAEMDPQASDFLVKDTRFWVVRPRIAGGEVSGLSTLLAGVYIGADPGTSQESQRDFEGLESPPVITSDTPGRAFTLYADDLGSLDVNSPVYYRGILAGRVAKTDVDPAGGRVKVEVFIHSPYDEFVNTQTRWWNASGLDFSLGASGVKLETQSLVTLLLGGISFETPAEEPKGQPVQAQTQLHALRRPHRRVQAARDRHRALRDEVHAIGARAGGGLHGRLPRRDRGPRDAHRPRLRPADRELPLGGAGGLLPAAHAPDQREARRALGHHARPAAHEELRRARPARAAARRQPAHRPALRRDRLHEERAARDAWTSPPSRPRSRRSAGGLGELQESIERIAKNLEKVPFEQIGKDVRQALADLHTTLGKIDTLTQHIDRDLTPEMRKAIEQARQTMSAAEAVLSTDSPVQGDLRDTLDQVNRAAESLRTLTDYLERHPESLIRGRRGDAK